MGFAVLQLEDICEAKRLIATKMWEFRITTYSISDVWMLPIEFQRLANFYLFRKLEVFNLRIHF